MLHNNGILHCANIQHKKKQQQQQFYYPWRMQILK